MTPGKKHQIFVPETPTGKNGRRKSDGTQVVKESPNIDALKQEVCLRNRTSFYSGIDWNVYFKLLLLKQFLNF